MRWRALPSLNVELLSSTRFLLFGAGNEYIRFRVLSVNKHVACVVLDRKRVVVWEVQAPWDATSRGACSAGASGTLPSWTMVVCHTRTPSDRVCLPWRTVWMVGGTRFVDTGHLHRSRVSCVFVGMMTVARVGMHVGMTAGSSSSGGSPRHLLWRNIVGTCDVHPNAWTPRGCSGAWLRCCSYWMRTAAGQYQAVDWRVHRRTGGQ